MVGDFPILLIDGLNLFIRNFSICPDVSSKTGENIGGYVGFLRSVEKLANMFSPSEIYVIWEGGGSSKRKSLLKEYKKGKSPTKLNRFYEDDIPQTDENKNFQLISLIKVLKTLPIKQVYVEDCEADDIIANLIHRNEFKDKKIIICSSDKDYYQLLLSENITQYSFAKKILIDKNLVKQEFEIPTINFCLSRTFVGDPSDNIEGMGGSGFKKITKNFPFLCEEKEYDLDYIFKYSEEQIDNKSKQKDFFKKVLENKELIIRNWKIMFLSDINISGTQNKKLDSILLSTLPKVDKLAMMRCLNEVGANNFDCDKLIFSIRNTQFSRKINP